MQEEAPDVDERHHQHEDEGHSPNLKMNDEPPKMFDEPEEAEAPPTAWLFDRAKSRDEARNHVTQSDWMFERAKSRRQFEDSDHQNTNKPSHKKKDKKWKNAHCGREDPDCSDFHKKWKKGKKHDSRKREKFEFAAHGYRGR